MISHESDTCLFQARAHETSQDRILAAPPSPPTLSSHTSPHRTAMFARLQVTDGWRRPLVSFDSFPDIRRVNLTIA